MAPDPGASGGAGGSRSHTKKTTAVRRSFCIALSRMRAFHAHGGFSYYIFSGALTPMTARDTAITRRTQSASRSLASSTPGSAPLMRQLV